MSTKRDTDLRTVTAFDDRGRQYWLFADGSTTDIRQDAPVFQRPRAAEIATQFGAQTEAAFEEEDYEND